MEEKKATESQKTWPFLWSKISLRLAAGAWLSVLFGVPVVFIINMLSGILTNYLGDCLVMIALLSILLAGFAFLTGLVSSIGFIQQKIDVKNKEVAFGGLGLSVFYFILVFILSPALKKTKDGGPGYVKVRCAANAKKMAIGLIIYQEENHSWPSKANWCDLIKPYIGLEDDGMLQCYVDKTGPCSYAMNENIPADS